MIPCILIKLCNFAFLTSIINSNVLNVCYKFAVGFKENIINVWEMFTLCYNGFIFFLIILFCILFLFIFFLENYSEEWNFDFGGNQTF